MDGLIKWFGFGMQCLTVLIIPFFKIWTEKINSCGNDISDVKDDLQKLKKDVAETYVRRDEYLSAVGKLDHKLDEITRLVYEIRGELKNKKI